MLSLLSIFIIYTSSAGATSGGTFWSEFDMMMLPNGLPGYLQDALEHATFEQLDLNNDQILSADELAMFKQSVARKASEAVIPAKGLSKDQARAQLNYPLFEIHENMPQNVRDIICILAVASSQIDFDAAWEQLAGDGAVLDADRLSTTISDMTQDSVQDLKFAEWKMFAEGDFFPKKFSKTPVVPEACNSRRRLFGGIAPVTGGAVNWGNVARIQFGIFATSLMAGAVETIFFECTASGHWGFNWSNDKCNMAQASKVTTVTFLGEEAVFAAAGALWAMQPEEAARDLRDGGRAISAITGQPMDTESFVPPFASCDFWGCNDDNNSPAQSASNMISNANPIPSSSNNDIQVGPVNIPNPSSFFGRRKQ
jgi:hypothetical protein